MMDTTQNSCDFTGANMRLIRAALGLFEVPQILEQIELEFGESGEKLSRIEQGQRLHENSLRELEDVQNKQAQALEAFYQRQNCMTEASRQLTLLSEQHFDMHIIEPLARRIFPSIDMLSEKISRCRNGSSQLDAFEAVKTELLDVLANYGVEPLVVVSKSAFNAKTMKPVSFTSTKQAGKDMTVNAVVRLGFRREERILRATMVDLYRFEISKTINCQTNQERKHDHD